MQVSFYKMALDLSDDRIENIITFTNAENLRIPLIGEQFRFTAIGRGKHHEVEGFENDLDYFVERIDHNLYVENTDGVNSVYSTFYKMTDSHTAVFVRPRVRTT